MRKFLQSWIIDTFAVLVAVKLVSGIHYQSALDLAVASLLLGVLNAILRPILLLLALPLVLFTLGLFSLVINASVLYLVASLMEPHFTVDGFWSAFWGALIISIVSLILNAFTGSGEAKIRIQRRPPPPPSDPGGSGPVIDI